MFMDDHDTNTITFQLTRSQLWSIANACEVVSRLHLNQFDVIKDVCHRKGQPFPDYHEFRKLELHLKQIFSPELSSNAYWGIFNVQISDDARTLWDIYQTIRYELSWESNPLGGMTVNYDQPYNSSKEQLPKITFEDPNTPIYLSFFRRLEYSINQMVDKSGWKEKSEKDKWINLCKEFALHENNHIATYNTPLPSKEYNEFFNLKSDDDDCYVIWDDSYVCSIEDGKLTRKRVDD
jgi:hypothetical protein